MIVWDADIYDEVFMVKDLKPLSCFHVHSSYAQIIKVFKYMLKYSASLRGDHYRLIGEMFRNNGREDTTHWQYMVTYSARTSLDLFLQAKNYPKGSEILMTAISAEGTIETVRGLNYSGRNEMKIVPIDIEWETMGPSLVNVKSKVTSKTKAIILSYPYGIIYDIKKIAEYCHQKGIDVIEDASEAFSGISTPGSQYADLTLLSFGMLRHYSWFGGAVSVIRRNQETFQKMLEIEKRYRKEKSFFYLTRVFKAFRLMTLLNSDKNFFLKMGRVLQQYKILHYNRKPMWKLRQRISLPWLRLLYSRLLEIDPVEDLKKYKKLIKFDFGGVLPGCQAMRNNYYLYPVIFREPKKVIVAWRMRGIQALAGPEVHWLVRNRTDSSNEDPTPEASRILKNITLLPINIETSESNIQKVHAEVVDAVVALNRGLQISPIRYISKI